MKFVSEKLIDEVALSLESSQGAYEEAVEQLREEQPVVLAYLFNDELKVFTQAEKEYLLYLVLVLWKSIETANPGEIPAVSANDFTEKEEKNWLLLQEQKKRSFRDKLDVFFDQYAQEDLLAFVEDALAEDEEESEAVVTKEGREAIFVILRSILDCWTQADSQKNWEHVLSLEQGIDVGFVMFPNRDGVLIYINPISFDSLDVFYGHCKWFVHLQEVACWQTG